MRRSKDAVKWVLAAALLASMPMAQAMADQPVAEKTVTSPGNIPPIPRAMPDLIPYDRFDPPKSPLFDLSKFTISGDMRVRLESRTNSNFGVSQTGAGRVNNAGNEAFMQQWVRIGLNYSISKDVDFFAQPQWAKNMGQAGGHSDNGSVCGGNNSICANDAFNVGQGDSLFMRQAFMMIRNLGIDGLSVKAGRQLIVMGNHRLFGHFDWANTGFSHDGITFQYNQPTWEFWGGYVRAMETDFGGFGAVNSSSQGVNPQGCGAAAGNNLSCTSKAGADSHLTFARLAFKPIAGLAIEPLWVWQKNDARMNDGGFNGAGAASATNGALAAHANGQSRHTLGARVAYRKGMFDGTVEGYWQTGSMELAGPGGNTDNKVHINAYALAAEGGLTFASIPWSPRVGVEFNMASGDNDAGTCNSQTGSAGCKGNANTFENLYPTNHIVMGYADLMAWRNMVAYSASLQMIPFDYAANHLEFRYWNFRKAQNGDCWYRAAQNCYYTPGANGGGEKHLADEIDVIYTLFFAGNKVSWQTGASYIIAGRYLDNIGNAGTGTGGRGDAVNQTWAYTQLHINF